MSFVVASNPDLHCTLGNFLEDRYTVSIPVKDTTSTTNNALNPFFEIEVYWVYKISETSDSSKTAIKKRAKTITEKVKRDSGFDKRSSKKGQLEKVCDTECTLGYVYV